MKPSAARGGFAAVAVAAGALGLVLAVAPAGSAESCAQMTLRYDATSPTLLTLSPADVRIPYRGCLQFTNGTRSAATFSVAPGYSQRVAAGATTTRAEAYVGTRSGRHDVTATSGPGSASGTVTVGRRPPSSPSPSRAPSAHRSPSPSPRPSPRPSRSSSPTARPSASASPSASPRAPSPRRSPSRSPRPSRTARPTHSPVPGQPAAPPPAAGGSSRGVVEAASGRGVGLPAALAALTIVATGTGIVRVLLAEPLGAVDDG